jgi:hypothetical protein
MQAPMTAVVRAVLRGICAVVIGAAVLVAPVAATAGKHKATASAPVTAGSLALFATEGGAQAHCPRDQVVWLNTNSGIYHEKGMRWYGNTKAGAYVCRKEADAAGNRDTRNGQ